jgi:hypothetical protein
MLFNILRELQGMGHSWEVVSGLRRRPGDVAILHVNSTVVGPEYLALGEGFRQRINFGTFDISKRRISDALVDRESDWSGPVIVKSNLNYMGRMEILHNHRARRRGLPPPHPDAVETRSYDVFDSLAEVPACIWDDDNLVVERFLPEVDPDGFAMRTWTFTGTFGRCMRHVSRHSIVKGLEIVRTEPAELPQDLQRKRAELGFDFGKFDFVVYEGRSILIDANRTPGSAPSLRKVMKTGARLHAQGFARMIELRST